jgi:hypothetical protein
LAAGLCGSGQDIQFRGQRSVKITSKLLASAGGEGGDIPMKVEKTLDFGQRGSGLGKQIKAELDESGVGAGNFGPFQQFRR